MKSFALHLCLIFALGSAFAQSTAQFDPRYDFPLSWKDNPALCGYHPTNKEELVWWFNAMMQTKGLGQYWKVEAARGQCEDERHPTWFTTGRVIVRSSDGTLWLWTGDFEFRALYAFCQQ